MTMPGETLATGAPGKCDECQQVLKLEVLQSAAGYYIGSQCYCGPYSRESGYYGKRKDAEEALKTNTFGRE